MNFIQKPYRFLWRLVRNLLCIFEISRHWIYPQEKLANNFGRGDQQYAWNIFVDHYTKLKNSGFNKAERILEIGPGRNLGTALLWWCHFYDSAKPEIEVKIDCWDVFENTKIDGDRYWSILADSLLENEERVCTKNLKPSDVVLLRETLSRVRSKSIIPHINLRIVPLSDLAYWSDRFDLIYSQAAIEHVWFIDFFWAVANKLTCEGGWHSHRIDLADHGRRNTNYIEMLQWSDWAYWLMLRFVPGATNRWRASNHLRRLEEMGFEVLYLHRDMRETLPVPRYYLNKQYRDLLEDDLKTTGLDVVALKPR